MPLPPRSADRPLNAEIERLLYQVSVVEQEAEGLVHGLGDSQLNWSPGDGQWSIGQCLDHLNVTNRSMLVNIGKSMEQGRAANLLSDGPFAYGFVSRWFHRIMQPPVKKKFKAPKNFLPGPPKSLQQIQADWAETHARIRAAVEQASGLDLVRVKVPSPAAAWLRYPLGIAFWIQTAHDRRHLWQARQVRNDPRFPKA